MELIEKSSIKELKSLLDYDDNKPYELAENILNKLKETDLKVFLSRTGDNEILIYREDKLGFRNILIDEDSDISYMFIGNNREDTNTYMVDDFSDENIQRVIVDFLK